MRSRLAATTATLVILIAAPLMAAEYYLSPSGDDANPGTLDRPWQTLDHADEVLTSGDVLFCRGGEFTDLHDAFQPKAPNITVTNYPGDSPVFRTIGRDFYGTTNIMYLDQDTITISGLQFRPLGVELSQYAIRVIGNHITLRNIVIDGPLINGVYTFETVLRIEGDYAEVDQCHLRGGGDTTIPEGHHGLTIAVFGNYANIHNNLLEKGVHTVVRLDGAYSIVRDNTIVHAIGYGVLLQVGSSHCLVERNTITGCDELLDYVKCPLYINGSESSIVRFNVGWNNEKGGLAHHAGSHNRIYNNVLFNNGTYGIKTWCSDGFVCADNVIMNNVVAHDLSLDGPCQYGFGEFLVATTFLDPAQDNRYRKNFVVVYDNGWLNDSDCAIYYYDGVSVFGYAKVSSFEAGGSNWLDNVYWGCDPMFVDPPNGDFRLRTGSCLIDAGAPLTVASSTGSGSSLPVQDALYFWPGDEIMIGGNQVRRIASADYDNNRLSLDSPASWSAGDAVTISYTGSAPDIGAYEYGAVSPVQVEDLRAERSEGVIALSWTLATATLSDVLGMRVERSDFGAGPFEARSSELLPPGRTMSFHDEEVEATQDYWYRLVSLDQGGEESVASVISVPALHGQMSTASLDLIPRGLGSQLEIRYSIPRTVADLRLDVFDIAGRRVKSLVRATSAAGVHVVTWNHRNDSGIQVARGVYLVTLRAEGTGLHRKYVLAYR